MARPVIGICTPLERAKLGPVGPAAFLLPRNYVDAVHRAGAMALLLAPDPALVEDPDEILDRLDGLMLAGGFDIDPQHLRRASATPRRSASCPSATRSRSRSCAARWSATCRCSGSAAAYRS